MAEGSVGVLKDLVAEIKRDDRAFVRPETPLEAYLQVKLRLMMDASAKAVEEALRDRNALVQHRASTTPGDPHAGRLTPAEARLKALIKEALIKAEHAPTGPPAFGSCEWPLFRWILGLALEKLMERETGYVDG